MIVDCFTFFDEFDVLEIRLKELSSVVDRFVLAEARQTFQGSPKPLYFQENAARFRPFLNKIEHLIVDLPETDDPWVREGCQRNALKGAIGQLPRERCVDTPPGPTGRPFLGGVSTQRSQGCNWTTTARRDGVYFRCR